MSGRISGNQSSHSTTEESTMNTDNTIRTIKPEDARFGRLAANVKKIANQRPFTPLPRAPRPLFGGVVGGAGVIAAVSGGAQVSNPVVTDGVKYHHVDDDPYGEVGTEMKVEMKIECNCAEEDSCTDGGGCEEIEYTIARHAVITNRESLCGLGILSGLDEEEKRREDLKTGTLKLDNGESEIISATWTPSKEDITPNELNDVEEEDGGANDHFFVVHFPNDSFDGQFIQVVSSFDKYPDKLKDEQD